MDVLTSEREWIGCLLKLYIYIWTWSDIVHVVLLEIKISFVSTYGLSAAQAGTKFIVSIVLSRGGTRFS